MKKVLVVRFSAIGDIILTAPVLELLHDNKFEIHFLVKTGFRSVATALPRIHTIWSWEHDREKIPFSSYTAILDLQGTAQSKSFVRKHASGIAVHTYNKPYLKRALLLWTKASVFALSPVVMRYVEAATPLLKMPISKSELTTIKGKLDPGHLARKKVEERLLQQIGPYPQLLVFVLGGSYRGKRMNFHQWKVVVQEARKFGLPIALLGGPEEAQLGESLEQPLGSRVYNFARDLTVLEGLALVEKATLVVSGDTGFMHAAAAFGKPLVSFWGATHPKLGFSPWSPAPGSVEIVSNSWLTPISKHGKVPLGLPNPMNNLPLDQVVVAIKNILGGQFT